MDNECIIDWLGWCGPYYVKQWKDDKVNEQVDTAHLQKHKVYLFWETFYVLTNTYST